MMNLFLGTRMPVFLTLTSEAKKKFLAQIAPLTYINRNSVPGVFTYALHDNMIGFGHVAKLEQRLSENEVKHKIIIMEKSDHTSEFDHAALEDFWNTSFQYGRQYLSPQP